MTEQMSEGGQGRGRRLEPLDLSRPPGPVDYLVSGVLTRGQPCLLGGPYKGLKSGLALDLAVSLATGTPFLVTFPVPRPVRVALYNGESGEQSLRRTVASICRAKGVEAPGPDQLRVFSSLPAAAEVGGHLDDAPADVVVLDPLYQLLQGDAASNLYLMGRQLADLGNSCLSRGATPLLVHHATEGLKPGQPADLSSLAFAGVKQYARQWLLLNRRSAYDLSRPNHHRLWLTAGGSSGHGELAGVTVDEGPARDRWEVTVRTAEETRAEDAPPAAEEVQEAQEPQGARRTPTPAAARAVGARKPTAMPRKRGKTVAPAAAWGHHPAHEEMF